MGARGPAATAPCGTPAALRRHLRHGEKPCEPCARAGREHSADRDGHDNGTRTIDSRPVRNNLPGFIPYIHQGRSPFMRRLAIDAGLLPEIRNRTWPSPSPGGSPSSSRPPSSSPQPSAQPRTPSRRGAPAASPSPRASSKPSSAPPGNTRPGRAAAHGSPPRATPRTSRAASTSTRPQRPTSRSGSASTAGSSGATRDRLRGAHQGRPPRRRPHRRPARRQTRRQPRRRLRAGSRTARPRRGRGAPGRGGARRPGGVTPGRRRAAPRRPAAGRLPEGVRADRQPRAGHQGSRWPVIITGPGMYDGMPEDEYHRDPVPEGSLSSTGARHMLPPSCPALYRYEQDHPVYKAVFDFGSAAHKMVLGTGPKLEIIEYDDWRTKDAQDRKKAARAAGFVPLLRRDMPASRR